MTDLISRSAALNVLEKHSADDLLYKSEYEGFESDLKAIPAIDAVPVVRCRDCFYRGLSDCPIFLTPDEGFCHIGSLTGD